MPTLKDVAKRANVSIATASYAINGSKLITPETKNKVLVAAKEIGYHPNGSAKNLKKNRSEIIGLFLSGFTGPFFNELLEGIQDVVIERGYEMVVCATVDRHRLLIEKHVDGAIILNYHITDQLIEDLASSRMPIVLLDRKVEGPFTKNVLLPNEAGIEQSVEHLVKKGHKRIGFIAGAIDSYDGETRLKGFLQAMEKHQIRFLPEDLIRADFTELSGLLSMKQYLEDQQTYPTAFISANDEMAMGAIKAVQEKGMSVPNDIAFIGFDDIALAQYFQPPLTTVRVLKKQWGMEAAETLFELLEGKKHVQVEPVPIEFISRSST
ncbi:LacI family DNA-binding transcriptional regulator [Alkalihalobacillus sp. 1P02AB]|uniref:LacI family DNA-binding transcriptional regulator n=1 Tax=Alkalihalobacillus sp. 1P02AB TaxID=3132260 RepID=UPI0039A6FF4A